MTKPLELKVYETDSTGRYMCANGVTYAAEAVNEFADWKRLTDTELAAEAYRQMARAFAVVGAVMVNDAEFAPADVVGGGPLSTETLQLGTIKRFATAPHYREDAA